MNTVGAALSGPPGAGDAAARALGDAWRPKLWQVWLVASAMLALIALPQILRFAPSDPDDYMRLLQVRDWLDGQSWFDVRQYRMNPPAGADMHWSRLVDLPIAAFLLVFRAFLSERAAETAAMCAVPLLQLGVAMWLVRRLVRELGASADTALAAAAIVPIFPLLTSNFLPLRIDHHGWQAVGALACAWLMVRGGYRAAFVAGLVAAAWQSISLEGLVLAAALGGLFAGRYWLWGRREHEAFLAGLGLAAPIIFFATRPAGDFLTAHCDELSWPHFAAFGAAGLVALASRWLPGQRKPLGRLLALSLLPLVGAPAILVPLGACAIDPFAGFDPVLKHFWLDNVIEGMPITRQPLSVAVMVLWTAGIVVVGARIALRQAQGASQRERWLMFAVLAMAASAMSLVVLRGALAAQLLATPFAAVLLVHVLPRARAIEATIPRIVATLACLGLATPIAASAAFKPLDGVASSRPADLAGASSEPCDLDRLNGLRAAKLFAPIDIGPEILARTPHSVVMGPYHRNHAKMREIVDAFTGPPTAARAIVMANGSQYVVACTDAGRLDVYAAAGRGNLADAIAAGKPPAWLEPVAGFERGSLRVYKVR